MSNQIAYDKITNQIIEALEDGHIPWEKPWAASNNGARSIHGKPYRGFNKLWLEFIAWKLGYSDPRWITFNQAKKMGGQVRKGEKSQAVTLWMEAFNHESSCPVKNTKTKCENIGKNKCSRYMLMRYFSVFNVEQVDGLDIKPMPAGIENDFDPIEQAEEIVNSYLEREGITLATGSEAFYTPAMDSITMPRRETFRSAESYYSTLFHECGHSTGHESRLNRKDNKVPVKFGDPIYAQEELVAEMSNAFIGGVTGVTNEIEGEQRVAYIQSWLRALRNDKKMVVLAAQQGQKAADLILGESA